MGDKGQMPIEEVFSECGSTPKDAISGAKYVPPTAEVMAFALEKGFATTTQLQGESKTPASGQQTPAGQFDNGFNWGNDNWQ